jgi:hypothetical protein
MNTLISKLQNVNPKKLALAGLVGIATWKVLTYLLMPTSTHFLLNAIDKVAEDIGRKSDFGAAPLADYISRVDVRNRLTEIAEKYSIERITTRQRGQMLSVKFRTHSRQWYRLDIVPCDRCACSTIREHKISQKQKQ